jgi:hypothetical protein
MASVFLIFKTSDEVYINGFSFVGLNQFELGNSIIANISFGLFVSCLFYFVTVWIPIQTKRKTLKSNYSSQYYEFKRNMIGHFLNASESSYSAELLTTLHDQKKFKEYFKENANEHQQRWDLVASNMDAYLLSKMKLEFDAFKESTSYILNNVEISNSEVFTFLHRFNKEVVLLQDISPDEYDEIKSFCRFLWELFSGWSWVDGYRKEDFFAKMIRGI